MDKHNPKPAGCNWYVMVGTFLAGVALGPVAWWQNDPLILGVAGLIPFFALLRQSEE